MDWSDSIKVFFDIVSLYLLCWTLSITWGVFDS
jgi:hypothetical protein